MTLTALVLLSLVLLTGAAPYLGRPGAVVLLAVAVLWLRVNQRMEGGILLVVAPGRGVTVADLASLAALVVAVVVWFLPPRRTDRG